MQVRMTLVYQEWINALKDRMGRARVQMRVDRLVQDIQAAILLARNL